MTNEPDVGVTLIRPRRGWVRLHLAELWEFRELLWALAARNVRVKYKQTLIGFAWTLMHPLVTMVVFTVFLGRLGGLDQKTSGASYPLLTLAALVPWYYFSHSVSGAVGSVVDNRNMIGKIYFPRILLPLVPSVSGLVDLAAALVVLLSIVLAFGPPPDTRLLALPLFILLAGATVAAAGLWLAGLAAHYRDIRFLTGFLLQAWMFVSPVAYSSSIIPAEYRPLYDLNPLVGVIEGFRWCLLGAPAPAPSIALSAGIVLLFLVSGLYVFRRLEAGFVDVV